MGGAVWQGDKDVRALTKKIFRDVRYRKLRTILTVLGVAIGMMSLSAINTASEQVRNSFEFSENVSARPDITFFTSPTNSDVAQEIQRQPNVKATQAVGYLPSRWTIASGHTPMNLIGIVDFQHVQVNPFELAEGNLPGPNQILLESSDRSLAPVHVGDQVMVEVNGIPQSLTVSGFARTQGYLPAVSGQAQGYMRETDLETLFHTLGVNQFLVQLNNYQQRNNTAKLLTQIFILQHVQVLGVTIGHEDTITSIVNGLFGTMRVLAGIALLLSIFLLLGTITTLVTEQIPVIGTMKALGARRGQLMRHYLILVLLYASGGTLLGLGVGILGGYLLVSYFSSTFGLDMGPLNVPPWLIGESLAIGIGTPLLAAALPVYLGTRISVYQALHRYGLDTQMVQSDSIWANIIRRFRLGVPQTMQLGMRNLFRRRMRAFLTLMTLAICGTAFLCVQTTTYSFSSFLDQVFHTYRFDVVVSLPQPLPSSVLQRTLASVPEVKRTEELMQFDVQTAWGDGLLTGVPVHPQLYQKQLLAGRWFRESDQNVVVMSKDGAEKSGLKVGDSVSFHDSSHGASWRIIGIVTDYNGIGPGSFGVLLTSVTQLKTFEHLPQGFIESFAIQSTSRQSGDVNALAAHVDTALNAAGFPSTIMTARQQIQRSQDRFEILYVLLYTVTVIVALVGVVSLFNTMAMSILERRREIGILRAMGATGRKIAQTFWTEGITLGFVAWIIALILGLPAAYAFVRLLGVLLAPVPFAFDPLNFLTMFAFILVVASVASVGPVWGATRIKMAQALRYE